MASDQAVAEVVAALQALYTGTDPQAKQRANLWLLEFQKTPQSWTTADRILNSGDTALEAKIFAAQTLRHKITYDLGELDTTAQLSLRDSLLNLLYNFRTGPKVIATQLCLSLAGLAVQVAEWTGVIPQMMQLYGTNPESVSCLMEFLAVLPEEANRERRSTMDPQAYDDRCEALLSRNAPTVVDTLTRFMQSPELGAGAREAILQCLRSWLNAGEISTGMLQGSPLMSVAFDSLRDPDLFEAAVDVTCTLVYDSKEADDVPALLASDIFPQLRAAHRYMRETWDQEDPELVRGFCRLFTEACESYIGILVRQLDTYGELLEALLECMTFPDLDIVPMTFTFWAQLTDRMQESVPVDRRAGLEPVFERLVGVILEHLRYPPEPSDWTAEQQDQFRAFRHDIGDVLKDCVVVLGTERALARPYAVLAEHVPAATSNTAAATPGPNDWQVIEAALFSLRAMGRTVDPESNGALGAIMGLLPRLPTHPKIRYAATLVIGRYTLWTRRHPDVIAFQLGFICDGFAFPEVAAASAMALRFLCQDCAPWLAQYLPQLHGLYATGLPSLHAKDVREITEAVAHVLAALPAGQVLPGLQPFCEPSLVRLAALAERGAGLSPTELTDLTDALERVTTFLTVTGEEGCVDEVQSLVAQVWPVVEKAVAAHVAYAPLGEVAARFFTCCTGPYGGSFVSQVPALARLLVECFQRSQLSCYLWVAKKLTVRYARPGDLIPTLLRLLGDLVPTFFAVVEARGCVEIPDVVEEFACLVAASLKEFPTRVYEAPWFGQLVGALLPLFAVGEPYALTALFRVFLTLLDTARANHQTPVVHRSEELAHRNLTPAAVTQLVAALRAHGATLTGIMVSGVAEGLDVSFIPDASLLVGDLVEVLPNEAAGWLADRIAAFPDSAYPPAAKQKFAEGLAHVVQHRAWDTLPRRLRDFSAVYRRRNRLGNAPAADS
ncbi:Nuclear import receptor [Tieghemiomyces parasiticus]|uniref:Nuclear import receptor n=1 Tax=Tieghemiomyces parasiticus TaxID=78921 RepID=A0A9W8AES2_9FUNG|nr:Nuclear import receptor [Tieghemiomyces parasiticus]